MTEGPGRSKYKNTVTGLHPAHGSLETLQSCKSIRAEMYICLFPFSLHSYTNDSRLWSVKYALERKLGVRKLGVLLVYFISYHSRNVPPNQLNRPNNKMKHRRLCQMLSEEERTLLPVQVTETVPERRSVCDFLPHRFTGPLKTTLPVTVIRVRSLPLSKLTLKSGS